MNELRRQMYLSALGVDTYMPQWHLPFAKASVACMIPTSLSVASGIDHYSVNVEHLAQLNPLPLKPAPAKATVTSMHNSIIDVFETKKIIKIEPLLNNVADIFAQLDSKTKPNVPASLDAFSLSVWRPIENLMIIDSRNTRLALPTDLLLNNILRNFFPEKAIDLTNEVLRWPAIENSVVRRTIVDAKNELQTWLSVQCEILPVKYLWLMGANATTYFLSSETESNNDLWRVSSVIDSSIRALILPSLNELLQQPLQKLQLYSAIKRYHS